MNGKEKKVVEKIISVLAENECTVAEAKLLLSATEKAILEKTTVQSPLEVYFDVQSINRPLTETLVRLGLTRRDRPEASQEK